tara:strand:+ start:37939 stop:38970 length:1032 start_codon:yes stop_codon:yes gene_type:complete
MKISEIKNNQSDKLNILSYNYDKKQYFSQETVSQSFHATDKINKLLIEINGNEYEILLSNFINNQKYMAQEDEFINETNQVKYLTTLEISDVKNDKQLFIQFNDNLNNEKHIPEELLNFVEQLIQKSEDYGIGLNYHKHINKEDEWGNIIPNKEKNTIASWNRFDNFILDNERIDFLNYMAALNESNHKESDQILKNVDINIEQKINQLIEEYKTNEELIFEEKENIGLNPYEEYEDNKYNETILNLKDKSSQIEKKLFKITCVEALSMYKRNSIFSHEYFLNKDIFENINDFGFLNASDRFKGMRDFLKLQTELKDIPEEFENIIKTEQKINNTAKRKNKLK